MARDSEYTPEEWGIPQPNARPVMMGGQPRGEARFPVPHPSMFGGTANFANRSYTYLFDEAISHSRENAERMLLDPCIDACMRLRTYPTALLTHHIEPDDDTDPIQVDAASKAERLLSYLPGFLFAKRHLLYDGILTGRTAQFVRWGWVPKRDRVWHMPQGFDPIQGDKLVFKFDGRVGVLVNGMFPGQTESGNISRAYFVTPEEREQMIVHKFEPTDAPFFKPQRAGQVHGLGLRDKLYWLWALKQRVWGMSMDFLQWFAKGLMVWYFNGHNDEHFQKLRTFVENQDGNSSIFIPWWENTAGFKPFEPVMPSTANPQFLQELITNYFDEMIKLLILGQSLTSGTASTGLGSGVAQAHQDTFANIIKYDAVALQETLTQDLLGPFYRANFPGVPPGRWAFDIDDPNVQQMLENAQALYGMGAAIPEGALMDAAGVPEVKSDDTVLTDVQPQQPAAVGGVPQGVPVVDGSSADGTDTGPVAGDQSQGAAVPAGIGGQSGGGPVQLSRGQASRLVRLARNGDRRAQSLLRTRRFTIR